MITVTDTVPAEPRGAAAVATPTQPGSDLQNFGARRGFELASVHRHSQHAVIADGAGQLDEALITEPLPQCAGGRLVDPVLAEELPGEVDNFGVFRRNPPCQ